MKDSECAKKVLDWAVREAVIASTDYQKAQCEEAARQAAEKMWNDYNPDDGAGGFSQNPYDREKEWNLKKIEYAAKASTEAHAVLEFVKHRICNLVKEEKQDPKKEHADKQ